MLSVSDILLKAYQKGTLAPLYILRSQTAQWGQEEIDLDSWTQNLASEILASQFSLSAEQARNKVEIGHSDLLFVHKDPDHKNYKAEEQGIIEFLKAHEYPPLELKQKCIFVHDADKLTPLLANRWLKTLEEPNENITTFLVIDGNAPLLETIESRAITFRIKNLSKTNQEKKDLPESFHTFVAQELSENKRIKDSLTEAQAGALQKAAEQQKIHHYLDFTRNGHHCEELLYHLVMEYATHSDLHGHGADNLLHEIQWYQQTKIYNNPQADRIIGLLQAVTTLDVGV